MKRLVNIRRSALEVNMLLGEFAIGCFVGEKTCLEACYALRTPVVILPLSKFRGCSSGENENADCEYVERKIWQCIEKGWVLL